MTIEGSREAATKAQQVAIDAIFTLTDPEVRYPRSNSEGASVRFANGDVLGISPDGWIGKVQFGSYSESMDKLVNKAIRKAKAAVKALASEVRGHLKSCVRFSGYAGTENDCSCGMGPDASEVR